MVDLTLNFCDTKIAVPPALDDSLQAANWLYPFIFKHDNSDSVIQISVKQITSSKLFTESKNILKLKIFS